MVYLLLSRWQQEKRGEGGEKGGTEERYLQKKKEGSGPGGCVS